MNNQESNQSAVLGQKYAYATASLILGISCFVSLLGMEKAILAIIFARLALKSTPAPALRERRAWAQAGIVLGSIVLVTVPTLLIVFFDRIREFVDLLEKFSSGR
jgi:hypothetical protein